MWIYFWACRKETWYRSTSGIHYNLVRYSLRGNTDNLDWSESSQGILWRKSFWETGNQESLAMMVVKILDITDRTKSLHAVCRWVRRNRVRSWKPKKCISHVFTDWSCYSRNIDTVTLSDCANEEIKPLVSSKADGRVTNYLAFQKSYLILLLLLLLFLCGKCS